jgi:hypothetical protein
MIDLSFLGDLLRSDFAVAASITHLCPRAWTRQICELRMANLLRSRNAGWSVSPLQLAKIARQEIIPCRFHFKFTTVLQKSQWTFKFVRRIDHMPKKRSVDFAG